jgi:uncharacterized membrane protein
VGYSFVPLRLRVFSWVNKHSDALIWVIWVGAALVFWGMGALKYTGLHNSEADLGLYANTLWMTLHGKLLGTAMTAGTYLNCHFSPSFLLLALLYAPWQSPIWLIGIQDITAASGGLALYLLVKHLSGGKLSGLLFGFLWVTSFALRGGTLYDFHEVTMISGLLMWLTYLIVRDKWLPALLLTLFLLGIKEDIPVYLAVLGFVIAGSFKKMKWGFSLLGLSIIYYMILQMFIWPALAPQHLDFVAVRFPVLAAENGNVIGHILSNPLPLLYFVNKDYSLWIILMVLFPVLFLPFLRWGGIGILLPLWMIVNLNIANFYLFATYHHICPVALVLIATVPGWLYLRTKVKISKQIWNWLLLSMGIIINLAIQRDILFSQLSPVSYSRHPSFERACKIAQQTPPATSIATDRMMGSLYSDHYFLDSFPSEVVTDRLYLSPLSMGLPQMILAIGGMGYKGVQVDPYLWFLGRDGEIDVKETFMERMRWMEAENSKLPAWQLKKDARASGGQVVFLPDMSDWGQRTVNTPNLLLPPGNYEYRIRVRTARTRKPRPRVYAEVRSTKQEGAENLIAGFVIPLNEDFIRLSYASFGCSFTINDWSQVHLNLNFNHLGDVYWDGISLAGLDATFDEYFGKMFPLNTEAYTKCTDNTLIAPDKDSYSGNVIAVSGSNRNADILKWTLGNEVTDGVYTLYYTVKSPEPVVENMQWATVFLTEKPNDPETYQEIARLYLSKDFINPGCYKLGTEQFQLEPNSTLIIRLNDDLDKKILLDKLWISPLERTW